ncbi:hypothetical protein [Frankia canadensis]|uniref:hypothetical protein n=1 Tax=Frankia canadensis TaxID=1836972 RepID=UPI001402C5AE|nr:hypothetical protein [Frankia canadensis]
MHPGEVSPRVVADDGGEPGPGAERGPGDRRVAGAAHPAGRPTVHRIGQAAEKAVDAVRNAVTPG